MIWRKLRRSAGYLAGVALLIGGMVILPMEGVAIVTVSGDPRDPQSMMGNRSPGSRAGGMLLDTKQDYAASTGGPGGDGGWSGGVPTEQGSGPKFAPAQSFGVLPGAGPQGGDAGFGFGYDGAGGGGASSGRGTGGSGGSGGNGTDGGGASGTGAGTGGTGGGGTGPGGPAGDGTGGTGACGGVGPGGGQVPIVTPVPEPQTWAMMILGITSVGAAMRRRNAALVAAEFGR